MMSDPKKQHPLTILISAIDQIKNFVLPMLFVFGLDFIIGETRNINLYFFLIPLGILVLTAVIAFIQWLFFTYAYKDNILTIKRGVFIKKERTIKRERIQTINLEAGIILRIFKLVKVNVETAGGLAESELEIKAIKKEEAYALKQALENGDNELESKETDEKGGYKVTTERLIIAGLTSGSVGIVMAIILAFASQFVALLPESVWTTLASFGVFIIVTIFIMFTLVSWLISIVRYAITYAFYTIRKDNGEFNITRGLIKQKHLSLKEHRIQSITMIEGVLRQPFNYQALEVDVAGGVTYKESTKTVVHPLIHDEELSEYFDYAFKDYDYFLNLTTLPKRARIRYFIRATIPFLFLIPLFIFIPWTLLLLILWGLNIIWANLRFKDAGYSIKDNQVVFRFRRIARTTSFTKKEHIQALNISRNILQRWRKLATVDIQVLSAPSSVTYRVKDLDIEDAIALYQWFKPHQN